MEAGSRYQLYREGEGPAAPVREGEADPDSRDRVGDGGGPVLGCRRCRFPITSRGDAVDVDGGHQHTFFNPGGVLFEIGCFAAAPGCGVSGAPTSEFSWFSGFRWRYASCLQCAAHVGWHFASSQGSSFFGLIVNRLVETDQTPDP